MRTIIPIYALLLGCSASPLEDVLPVSQHLGVTGLFTDPNPHTAAPDGALDVAREVVFRRVGTVQQRPGFKAASAISLGSIWKMIPFDTSVLHIGNATGGEPTINTRWSSGTGVRDENSAALDWTRHGTRGAIARKNLYITTDDATRRVTSSTDTTAHPSGLLPPYLAYAEEEVGGSVVANNNSVAYRATLELTLSNGHIITSAPSGRVVYKNTAGGGRNPRVFYGYDVKAVPSGATLNLKLYRTKNTTSDTPPDEMFLVRVHATNGVPSNSTTVSDATLDANLGEKLYTSPTREGIERANVRPPAAQDVALYKGSLFFARLALQAKRTFSWLESGAITTAAGIGTRTYTGTRTNGSAVITGLSSTTGLQVGMVLTDATSWTGTAPIRITSIVGADATMSNTWTGATDGAPVAITFADSICVGSTATASNYYRADTAANLLTGFNSGLATALGSMDASTTAFAFSVRDASRTENTTRQTGPRTVTIEALKAVTTLTISATHGDEYDDPIPLHTATQESQPPQSVVNGYGWTKTDQPDHYLRGALQYAGNEKVPTLRILPTTEALWFLKGKGDGIYRLVGEGERSGWRLDQFDSSVYLLHPELAVAFGDTIYAWTNVGAVAISSAGVIRLSEPAIGHQFRNLQIALDHDEVNDTGAFCTANEKDHEIIWGLPPSSVDSHTPETTLVLNTKTKAWSEWFFNEELYCSVAYDPETRLLRFGGDGNGTPRVERDELADVVRYADLEHACTINSITSATRTVVIAGGSNWTPEVGDLLVRAGVFCVVTLVNSSTSFVVHDLGALTTGAATAYVAYESYIRWLNEAENAPSYVKNFQTMITHWEDATAIYTWDVEFETPATIDTPTVLPYTRTYDRNNTRDFPDDHEAYASRKESRASRILPAIRIRQADARWRIGGATLEFEPIAATQRAQRGASP